MLRIPPRWLGHVVAGLVSLTAAFFIVFNVLFSDVPSWSQRLLAIGWVGIVYFGLSFGLHWVWSVPGKAWRLWLMIPGGVAGLFITLSDYAIDRLAYPVLVLFFMVFGTWLGWWFCRHRITLPGLPFGKL
jgi:hypothetical protein